MMFFRALMLIMALAAHAEEPAPRGAGCLVASGGRLLAVRELWSRKWTVPGGSLEAGETPARAAQRETFEETGVAVDAIALLERFDGRFQLYQCVPKELLVFTVDRRMVPPRARLETIEVRWLDPLTTDADDWRFPEQRARIVELATADRGMVSPALVAMRGQVPASDIPQWQARGLAAVKAAQEALPGTFLSGLMRLFSLFGEEPMFFLVIGYFWLPRHGSRGPRFAGLMLLSLVINSLLKDWGGFPRPFELLPSLQLAPGRGPGMPSGHAQASLLLYGLIAFELRRLWAWVACITIVLLTGFSRVHLGVHFPQDVIGGWLAGLAVLLPWLAAQHKLRPAFGRSRPLLATVYLLVAAAALAIYPHPDVVAALAVGLGLLSTPAALVAPRSAKSWVRRRPLLAWTLIVAGLFTLGHGLKLIWPFEATFPSLLAAHVASYLLLGVFLAHVRRFFI